MISLSGIFAISIINCNSGTGTWNCSSDNICTCRISGKCSNGDLLIYKNNINDLLCAPSISGSTVNISWDNCANPSGKVKIRADCEEGQSSEEITIYSNIKNLHYTIFFRIK